MTRWWTGFGDCNMGFENGVVPEDWRPDMIVPLYKCKGKKP